MANYYLKRFGQSVFTLYAVVTLSFALFRAMPGGPAQFLRAQLIQQQQGQVSEAQLNSLVSAYINLNPDKPLHEQYVEYMLSVMQGDLGQSIWFNRPVIDILAQALPWTIFISALTLALSFGIGVVLGAVLAYDEGSRFDVTTSSAATFLTSIPYYLIAVAMVYFLGYQLQLFPTGGTYAYEEVTPGFNVPFLISVFYHAAMPVLSVVITGIGGWALSMRGNAISVLGQDYIRVAKLRGLKPRRIATLYVGRNAVLPMYTSLMISMGTLVGGSVILEQIFRYEGLGYYTFRAVQTSDYPLLMGAVILGTTVVIAGILVADLTYGFIDPRASSGGDRESY